MIFFDFMGIRNGFAKKRRGYSFTSNRSLLLKDIVFTDRIKTRTFLLWIQIPMADHQHLRKLPFQVLNQFLHRSNLFFGTGIGRLSFCIQTAFVTNADAMTVVMNAMRSVSFDRATIVYRSVFRNVKVIPDVGIAPVVYVIPTASLERVVLRDARSGAMDDD